jgi:hypothetical protein
MKRTEHAESRHFWLYCTCGYRAKDKHDLREHLEALASLDDLNEEEE